LNLLNLLRLNLNLLAFNLLGLLRLNLNLLAFNLLLNLPCLNLNLNLNTTKKRQ